MNNFQQQFEALYGGVDIASMQSNVPSSNTSNLPSSTTDLLLPILGIILVTGVVVYVLYLNSKEEEKKPKIYVSKN